MSNILVPSQKEIAHLVDTFKRIGSMQARMKVVDLAERFARDTANASSKNPKSKSSTELSHAVVLEDRKVIAIRQRQSFDDRANCA